MNFWKFKYHGRNTIKFKITNFCCLEIDGIQKKSEFRIFKSYLVEIHSTHLQINLLREKRRN